MRVELLNGKSLPEGSRYDATAPEDATDPNSPYKVIVLIHPTDIGVLADEEIGNVPGVPGVPADNKAPE